MVNVDAVREAGRAVRTGLDDAEAAGERQRLVQATGIADRGVGAAAEQAALLVRVCSVLPPQILSTQLKRGSAQASCVSCSTRSSSEAVSLASITSSASSIRVQGNRSGTRSIAALRIASKRVKAWRSIV